MEEQINKQEEFTKGFNKLVKDTGCTLQAFPAFKLRDDGTFSIVVELKIVEMKNPNIVKYNTYLENK